MDDRKKAGSKLSIFFFFLAAILIVLGGYLYQYDLNQYQSNQENVFSGFAAKKSYNATDIQGYDFVHDKIYKDNYVQNRTRDQMVIGMGIVAAIMGVATRKRETM